MKITEFIWTPKLRAIMRETAQIIFLMGATGCSKSIIAGMKFADLMLNSPANETQYFIVAKDIGTGVRNILHNKDSFYNLFDFCRDEYRNTTGGVQFVFHGLHGDKIVYIVGAGDRNSWQKILGSNPKGLWLEELSELEIDCVRECMGRAISRKCDLIATSNGGLPDQEFYKEFVNHAVVRFKDTVPSLELADMVEDKPYMAYFHLNAIDDAPHLSTEEKAKLLELYPVGSFYYNSKILGVRGYVDGAAYADKMDDAIHVRDYDDIAFTHLKEIILGVDIGASLDSSNQKKSATVATLTGWSQGYQRAIVLECWVIPADSHDDIIAEIERRLLPYWVKYMGLFKNIEVDSAEHILINTWKTKTRLGTVSINSAVKYVKDAITLVTRCGMKQQLIHNERLLWSTKALSSYQAHKRIMVDEDGAEIDLAVQDNDKADSLTYTITARWNDIMRQAKRRE